MDKKTLQKADSALFRKVVDALNRKETFQWTEAEYEAFEREYFPGATAPAQLAEIVAGLNQQNEAMWNSMQSDLREDFEFLAKHGRLSPDAADWAVKTFTEDSTVKPEVKVNGGHATITYRPQFQSLYAAIAYVMLRLSEVDDVSFGICRKCGDLWFDDRPGKGRRREGFCSDAHRTAFTQAVYRANRAKAARHK